MVTTIFFLSSGLFLGWTLGANDAANIWGTSVETGMVRFKKAALICSIFVTAGAVVSGFGSSHGLGRLGQIDALAGAFTVALSAGLSVLWMTRLGLPVSVTHAIVGSIIGWNIFSSTRIDYSALSRILSTWIFSPVLTAGFAVLFYYLIRYMLRRSHIHLIRLDMWTRISMVLIGAFGSYSLGANNIGNVIGVFIPGNPFSDLQVGNFFAFSSIHQLLLLGGIAISFGVFMYSRNVMRTVGTQIYRLSPFDALIVILSSAIVLFLFSSRSLKMVLVSSGLPSFPLVPVSSSQSVVGGIIGIGFAKGALRNINFAVVRRIVFSWAASPSIAGLTSYVLLFIVQNVFGQIVL